MLLAGRFELLRRLGAGGLAEVFLARDQMSGQEVALKALHAHLAETPELSARFRREMAVTRGLDHPGIVRVFDLHEHEGRPFFSMEALRGCTLAEKLRDGPLPAEEARRIARRICQALQAAHRAGVVHRDLKPQNVFLGEDGAVKLLDFGLARVAGQARLTVHSAVMGTPGYIAPELLSGAEADARADIYSLGATLFEMLTGQHAFPGSDPYEVLRRQREGAPATPGADPACAEVVKRSLEPDVERRFLDAEQVLRALGGEHVPAPPEPQPGLSAGQFDVMVQHEGFGEGKKLKAITARLGAAPPTLGWRMRHALDGKNRLVAGADRETAEAVAALCRDQGLPATVAPARTRWRVLEWLARRSKRIGGALSAVMPLFTLYMVLKLNEGPWTSLLMKVLSEGQTYNLWFTLWAIVYVPVAGILSLGAAPPLKDLPRGDPALRRLAQGIARRVARLRQKVETLPDAQKMILDDLLREAAETQSLAVRLAENAQPAAAALPEAETLPHGTSRDRLAGRLLEIAAALDDALEIAAQPSPDAQAASGALSRLRAEIAFARQALPAVEAARRGETTPDGLRQPRVGQR
jgi:hypothetical protein